MLTNGKLTDQMQFALQMKLAKEALKPGGGGLAAIARSPLLQENDFSKDFVRYFGPRVNSMMTQQIMSALNQNMVGNNMMGAMGGNNMMGVMGGNVMPSAMGGNMATMGGNVMPPMGGNMATSIGGRKGIFFVVLFFFLFLHHQQFFKAKSSP